MVPGHAERPDRLRAITRWLTDTGLLADLTVRTAQPVSDDLLATVHDRRYLETLTALSPKRPDTPRGLNPRLQKLIDKQLSGGNLVKLEQRLKTIQRKAN